MRQWDDKQRLFDLHRQIQALTGWPPERLALAREFLEARDRMYRETWGLGPVRHVLHPRYFPPGWLAEYQEQVQRLGASAQAMNEA